MKLLQAGMILRKLFFIKKEMVLHLISINNYSTPTERPRFSVMDKTKHKANFNTEIPHWRDSLRIALKIYI